ncbi:flagellar motor switch protein FliG [Desulfatibacillum alkenivorans DSM 16219]|jgi:flagellar motor switch protein FliG|uniref:Flagellar motor switch protein FliG n=1 Tax=Desulfatibacillum alkenivorans DSM 16219 TaxID=1121393 RepID=A0A1M6V3K5_9BACT|nr:flagellar motor switch protein FliG [Desulfatibacillum alkenivorans]SHK75984.1 flagellar motor switch protein FliG [Desulfatibacillum alkenivorans DSM 16219]
MSGKTLDPEKLTGPEKAAIFLLAMGEDYASKVMKNMAPKEVNRIANHMKEIQFVPSSVLTKVYEEFVDKVERKDELMIQGDQFVKKVVHSTFDEITIKEIFQDLDAEEREEPFAYIEKIDPQALIRILSGEHPQTVALVLAHMKPGQAAAVLAGMPKEVQADIAMRVADINQVPIEIIHEVDSSLQKEVLTISDSGGREIGGAEALANILNEVDKATEETVMTTMEEERTEIAEKVRQLMFVFEDLLKVDDKGMREILKQVDTSELVVALKSASEAMKDKVFGNLSQRAAEMLREDMEVMGPTRLAEVEAAQQGVIRIARQLEAEGKVVIARGSEDVLV